MPFTFDTSDIDRYNFDSPSPIIIYPKKFWDDRGFFVELYKESDFIMGGINECFEQDNLSSSRRGVIRGLHFQKLPKPQGKLVRVLKGSIFDVAVDIRKLSKSYKKWMSVILTADNCKMFYIPPGYAHGFLALEDNTIIEYKCTNEYDATLDFGIRWDDPSINIKWPDGYDFIISDKDKVLPTLTSIEDII